MSSGLTVLSFKQQVELVNHCNLLSNYNFKTHSGTLEAAKLYSCSVEFICPILRKFLFY